MAVPIEGYSVVAQKARIKHLLEDDAIEMDPNNAGLIGNLTLAYLLAGQVAEAKGSIAAAIKIDRSDKINDYLNQVIAEVANGKRPQPNSPADLSSTPAKPRKRFWEFWKN